MMDEGLRLACPAAFDGIHADHFTLERPGSIPLRASREMILLFNVHGALELPGTAASVPLRPTEALLVAGPGLVEIRHSAGAEMYILRLRRAVLPRGLPRRRVEVPDHVTVRRPARLTHLLRRLIDEIRVPRPSRAVLNHLAVLALCELAQSSTVATAAAGSEAGLENIASRVDAFIAAHYHEPISTLDIARELHYNPDYLERAFHLERHMSIREALHTRRIKEARAQLILQQGKGVAEIAALCGYTDAGYFRRVFKRATNMTPHGYRLLNLAPRRAPAGLAAGART
jgi:AraC-like DNA-binding protein